MRVLLRPVLVPELGLVVLKPGRESLPVFHRGRVLVEPEPKNMRALPSGAVPAVRQPLAEDKSLLPFFSDERVIRAAGGAGALSDWLLRHVKSCQWPHGDYHHSETVIHSYGAGAMVLCWHCDNQLRDQTSESLEQLTQQNLTAWMIDVIRHVMNGTQERELSLAELSWWAVCNQVVDALPEAVSRRSLGLPAEKIRSVYRESDIIPGEQTATSILKQRTKNIALPPHTHQQQNPPQEKTAESPESFMKRPKRRRWVNEKYTRWVKTQPCACCGKPADDPHHLIGHGHGQGGMGTKSHDIFTLPLCREHHNELHADPLAFEEKHGSQVDLIFNPPTVNTYWRRRGSTYFVSKAGERYRRAVALIVRQQRLKLSLSGRLAIKIIAEPPDKRRRDLDNILKAPLDALTHAGVLMDDEQFDEINIVRGQPVSGGRLGVKIYPIMLEGLVKK
ncbi:hypothetical protein DIV12_28135 [Escherichia coli]|nr:hypothetical protein DIV12_28135 [Escherichia coli]